MKQLYTPRLFEKWLVALCVLSVLIGLIGRAHDLSVAFVWFDESLSLRVSNLTHQQILNLYYVSIDSHPPFHYLVIAAIRRFWPDSEVAIRLFVLLCSIATLVVIYLAAKLLMPPVYALLPVSVFALNAVFVFESVAIRGYPLLFLSTAVLTYFSLKVYRTPRPKLTDYVGLFVAACISTYTHYFGILTLLFPCALALAREFERRHQLNKHIDALSVVSFLALVASLPVAWLAYRHSGSAGYAHFIDAHQLPLGQALMPFQWFSVWRPGGGGLEEALSILNRISLVSPDVINALFALLVAFFCIEGVWRMSNRQELRAVAFSIAVSGLGYSLFAVAVSMRVVTMPHYYSVFMLLMSLAGAYFLYDCICRRQTILAAFIVFVWVAGLGLSAQAAIVRMINDTPYVNAPNWRAFGNALKQVDSPKDPLVVLGWDATPLSYYMGRSFITSYQFEQDVKEGKCGPRYLIIASPFGRNDVVPASATLLFDWKNGVTAWHYRC